MHGAGGGVASPAAEIAALELLPAIDALRWLAENARRLLGAHRFPLPRVLHPLTRASAGHAPVGVVGIRGAAGAPFAEPLASVGAALLAGNGAMLAPGPGAADAGSRIAGVIARAGVPEGLVRVANVSLARCARVIEEGAGPRGPDAMIVLADARVTSAADGAAWAACAGAGALAGSLKRVYVSRECHAAFLEELCRAAAEVELGDPLADTTQLGPLADAAVAGALDAAIAEAVAGGATLHCGGPRPVTGSDGVFYAPAVLSGVPPGARLAHERVSGPVLAVTAVEDSVSAVTLANEAGHSVGASIWSSDRRAAVRIARELHARVVWGNDHPPAAPARQLAGRGARALHPGAADRVGSSGAAAPVGLPLRRRRDPGGRGARSAPVEPRRGPRTCPARGWLVGAAPRRPHAAALSAAPAQRTVNEAL